MGVRGEAVVRVPPAYTDYTRQRRTGVTRLRAVSRSAVGMAVSHPGVSLFVPAFVVRAIFVMIQLRFGVFDISFEATDSTLYRGLADSLVGRGAYSLDGTPTAFVTPGYPLFLAVLYVVSRSGLFIGLVQAGLGAATVVALAAIAHRLAGRDAALATGIMAAFYPHLVFWTGYVLTETLYVFILSVALLAAARALESNRPLRRAAMAGALFGAASLVRPVALGFGIMLAVAGIFSTRYRVRVLLGLGTLTLVLAPWVARNAVVLDSPIITSTESGHVLWQGNSPEASGGSRGYVDGLDFEPLELPEGISETEADRIHRAEALSWMAKHPARVAALIPKKLWNMWRPTYQGASALNSTVTYVTYLPLLALAVPGLVLSRRRDVLGGIVVAFVAYHLVVHGLVTGMIRFRLPVEAVLTIPAGVTVGMFVEKSRNRA